MLWSVSCAVSPFTITAGEMSMAASGGTSEMLMVRLLVAVRPSAAVTRSVTVYVPCLRYVTGVFTRVEVSSFAPGMLQLYR